MNTDIRERIKEIRKEQKMTQKQFGDRLTLSQSQIACYENGFSFIPPRVIKQIQKEFGINEDWLLTGTGEKYSISNQDLELAETLAILTLSENPLLKELASKLVKLDTEHLESINNLVDLLIKKEQV